MKTRFVEAVGNQIFRGNCFFQPQLSDTRHKGTTARSDKEQKQEEGANESKYKGTTDTNHKYKSQIQNTKYMI